MADSINSDQEFASVEQPVGPGIQLVRHARVSVDDVVSDTLVVGAAGKDKNVNSMKGSEPQEDVVFRLEIKAESQSGPVIDQGIDLDAILDELESGSAQLQTSAITSAMPDCNGQTAPLNLSKKRIKDEEGVSTSVAVPGDQPCTSKSVTFQDVAVSSSWIEDSSFPHGQDLLPIASNEEGRQEVTSTTEIMPRLEMQSMTSPSWNAAPGRIRSLGLNSGISGKIWRYTCKHCEFTSTSYSRMYSHLKRLHSRLTKKGKLAAHYGKSFGLTSKKNVPTLYACQHCNYITLKIQGFSIHSQKRHPRRKANPLKQGTPITSMVNRKYLEALYRSGDGPPRSREKIRRLLMAYHRDSKVLRSDTSPATGPRLSRGMSRRLVCIICDDEFSTRSRLNEHCRLAHPEQGPKKNLTTGLFHCKLCPHDSMSRTALRRHYSRSHFMDAFYAWNVPCLEEQFMERDRNLHEKGTGLMGSLPDASRGRLVEKMDAFMESSLQWKVEETTENQVVESRIPCILCDFSTQNVVGLLLHYQNKHESYYPRGFKALLLKGLVQHTREANVSSRDIALMNGVGGAWLRANNQVTRLYGTFACQLCIFKCSKFQAMAEHFVEFHPDVDNHTKYIEPLDFPVETEMTNGKKQYSCEFCEFAGDEVTLKVHYIESHSSRLSNVQSLKLAIASDSNQSYVCLSCEFCSENSTDLAFHYQRMHFHQAATFTTPKNDDGYQCILCMAITPSLGGMIRHHRKHKWRGNLTAALHCLYCTHCRRIFASPQHLWGHIVNEHTTFSRLIRVSDLPSHVIKFGFWKEDELPDLPHVLTNKYLDGGRRASRSPEANDRDFEGEQVPSKKAKCTGKPTGAPRVPGNKVSCKFCNLITTHPRNMRRHLQAVHWHDVSYRCFKCSDETVCVTDCLQHHQHVHGLAINRQTAHNFLLNDIVTTCEGNGKFMCAWCGYQGVSRMSVLSHLNSRHILSNRDTAGPGKESKFYCKWCDYYTNNPRSMRAHIRTRHNRIISYHSLKTFRSCDSISSESSDQDDEDYMPSAGKRLQRLSPSSQKAAFDLVEDCAFATDSDCSGDEVYRSTHVRNKHQIRYPHICKFCSKAYVCSTKFSKHCISDHSNWCSIQSDLKNILVVPDPQAVQTMLLSAGEMHDRGYQKAVYHDGDWRCELCKDGWFGSLLDLQQHIWTTHNGKKLYMCMYCEFISFDVKTAALHGHHHYQKIHRQHSPSHGFANVDHDAKGDEVLMDYAELNIVSVDNTFSELDIVSGHADDNLPDLNPVSRSPFRDVSDVFHKKARKSTRSVLVAPTLAKVHPESVRRQPGGNLSDEEDDDVETSATKINIGHSVCHLGIIRCDKCDFCCTDPERMASHVKSAHMSMKQYACKFCEYVSEGFLGLDGHLAEFHKIKRNHQLGLQLKFAMQNGTEVPEKAIQSISEMKSRFLYTPTPSLPIIRAEVEYLAPSTESLLLNNDAEVSGIIEQPTTSAKADAAMSRMVGHKEGELLTKERFKCSYCGHVAVSTYKLEMHMKRHEGNFQQDFGSLDSMGYKMNKMDIIYKVP